MQLLKIYPIKKNAPDKPVISMSGIIGKIENMTTKEKRKEIIEAQPEDATYEEIVRELAFTGMVDRGLRDVCQVA